MRRLAAALLVCLAAPIWAQDQDVQAETLLKRIDELVTPALDPTRSGDPAYPKEFQTKLREVIRVRSNLIGELFRVAPEHPRIGELLNRRWTDVELLVEKPEDLRAAYLRGLQETETVLQNPPQGAADDHYDHSQWPPTFIKQPALYWRSVFKMRLAEPSFDQVFEAAKLYGKDVPEDPGRAISLLAQAAFTAREPQNAARAYRYILESYKDDPQVSAFAGLLRKLESVGKPVTLKVPSLSGTGVIDTSAFKGKVVVVEFFSATLSTSVNRLSTLKMLSNELGPKGLQIVSISLDEPSVSGQITEGGAVLTGEGLLKAWVAENKVDWFVGWSRDSVKKDWIDGWGVVGLPMMFIIDRQGQLRHTGEPANLKGVLEKLLEAK